VAFSAEDVVETASAKGTAVSTFTLDVALVSEGAEAFTEGATGTAGAAASWVVLALIPRVVWRAWIWDS